MADLGARKPVADFKTHITTSTVIGIGYASGAYTVLHVPAPTCALAGVLCSVSGMLPDLDSDSGIPLRESLAFAAACVPMMLTARFEAKGWPTETIVLAGALLYIVVRFGLGTLLKKYTVHRGMFHSIPAAFIAGGCAFLLCATGDIYLRAFKAGGVLIGFFSHLILDEIWSIRVSGGRIGLKSSSGTAMKLWGNDNWGNLSCYGKLILVGVLVLNDPIWAGVSPEGDRLHAAASAAVNSTSLASTLIKKVEQKVLSTGDALTNRVATSQGTQSPAASSIAAQQQSSPALQQQQQQQQAYAAQQAAAQQAAQQAAHQQQLYQQQVYQQQLYQQQLQQQQLAQAQAAYQAQYQQRYYQQPQPNYAPYQNQPQQYQSPADPRTQMPQAYQPQQNYGWQPRAGQPTTRRY